ncbi:MAG TPA: TIM barrel protein [Negativicutes bacterium]|nr:TIM barrel protein [Negativicutes bacterium]
MQQAHFGPAGNPDAFYAAGHKASAEMPAWLAGMGLNAYEYQCSRGVTIREETARTIGEAARLHGVSLSVHAPYYINLATEDPAIAANTTRHLLKSLEAARWLGADRVTFHIGGPGKQPRSQAIERATSLFLTVLEAADRQGLLAGVYLAPETMGKQNQLGNLEEVLAFCALSEWTVPTIDFGHLHAVTGGGYTSRAEYEAAFDLVAEKLGERRAAAVHIHFSRIEFTKAGEKRHWTFADAFGPPHEPLLEVIAARGYTPRIVCESAGTQALDAKTMQEYYRTLLPA